MSAGAGADGAMVALPAKADLAERPARWGQPDLAVDIGIRPASFAGDARFRERSTQSSRFAEE